MTTNTANLPGFIPLYTRTGREIPNLQLPDLAPYVAERSMKLQRKSHPLVQLRRPPTGQYNCHGLCFASRRTCITDPSAVQLVLGEDGYRAVPKNDVQAGDIAAYYDQGEIAHTGVVIRVDRGGEILGGQAVWVMSKWGQDAEYIHVSTDSPYDSTNLMYWTDRP